MDVDARAVEGAFNAASVGSWRSVAGKVPKEFLRSTSGSGLLVLPEALSVGAWDFLKLRAINELEGVLSCDKVGRPLAEATSFGRVGLRAPCASLCFVEIPLPEARSLGAIPGILTCGLLDRRGIFGGKADEPFARETLLDIRGPSEGEGSEKREVGEGDWCDWLCSSGFCFSCYEVGGRDKCKQQTIDTLSVAFGSLGAVFESERLGNGNFSRTVAVCFAPSLCVREDKILD
jgi:hypothetical protein